MSKVDSHDFLAHHQSGHYRSQRSWRTNRLAPRDHLVIWCRAGDMEIVTEGAAHTAVAGDVVVLLPGRSHQYEPSTAAPWEWWWLHVGGSAAGSLAVRLRGLAGPVRRLGADPVITARFAELVTASSAAEVTADPAEQLFLDATAHALLATMIRAVETRDAEITGFGRTLVPVTTWILDHLDTPFSLAELAAVSGWSPAQLSRITQRDLGMSPIYYATALRMRQASRLLRDSDLSVAAVAGMVGFDDPLHFSRRFRQVVGVSPRAYREADEILGP